MIEQGVEELAKTIGIQAACSALAVPRGAIYRARKPIQEKVKRKCSIRAISKGEEEEIRWELNSERFQDLAPREVYATLMDEGRYLCSWRSMYRILNKNKEVRERRNQLRHPNYTKPELLATGPNELWSWDITKMLGPQKWSYYHLYTILDVYSRYVVGWMIADRESAELAQELITETYKRQGIKPGQLTIHADRGSSMTSKSVAYLMTDLGVTKTHSRPHVSNDNPYSESHFKTMKYQPDYPKCFGSLEDARSWAQTFFNWYNYEHHHSSISLLTPDKVHYDRSEEVLKKRQGVLEAAYGKNPQRFVKGMPNKGCLPTAVWINPPKPGVVLEEPVAVSNEIEV